MSDIARTLALRVVGEALGMKEDSMIGLLEEDQDGIRATTQWDAETVTGEVERSLASLLPRLLTPLLDIAEDLQA